MPGSIADIPETRALTRFATSMTQPEQLALMGGIGKLTGIPVTAVQTYFAGQMGAGAIEGLAGIKDALAKGDTDRARELAVETGLNTWFAAEAGRGARGRECYRTKTRAGEHQVPADRHRRSRTPGSLCRFAARYTVQSRRNPEIRPIRAGSDRAS